MSERPHTKLDVWNKSIELVSKIYRYTAEFPTTETYGLASQMRRASVSIPANIAEGAARKGVKEYLQFLYTSRGSLSELDTHVELSHRLGFLREEGRQDLLQEINGISRMLSGLISYLSGKPDETIEIPSPITHHPSRSLRGQATTEVVLLFPLFMFFLFLFAKLFALLVLVQKMEVASYYAARRWQLESHRWAKYVGTTDENVRLDIVRRTADYLGCNKASVRAFLDLANCNNSDMVQVVRTQVWNVVTLNVVTRPAKLPAFICEDPKARRSPMCSGFTFQVTKYVPNRDRPIKFQLPGLQP